MYFIFLLRNAQFVHAITLSEDLSDLLIWSFEVMHFEVAWLFSE